MYKVLIPTAGMGSRLGNYCDHVNKTLVPVANKPIISYIIEKFPLDVEIIIDLGHKGDLVQQFLSLAYPERKFTFVWAKRQGLTQDLFDYEPILQCPFIFFTNDAIVLEKIPPPDKDWVGYSDIEAGVDYRSVVLDQWDKNIAKSIGKKGKFINAKAYIGICGVHNYQDFWKAMEDGVSTNSNEGESYGLEILARPGIAAHKFTWLDTGTREALKYANEQLRTANEPNLLPKTEEHIWFCNGKVVKFSTDETFIYNRVQRAKQLSGCVPEIIGDTQNMYAYKMVDGRVLSQTVDVIRFDLFLQWVEKLWAQRSPLTPSLKKCFKTFYKDKTFRRVEEYFQRFNYRDSEQIINGIKTPTINTLLSSIDWDWLSRGIPVRFHGDLHFENILDTEDSFSLLDWRQDFGGLKDYGDLYYDLAKIMHGLIVNHGIIHRNLYEVNIEHNIINFDFMRRNILVDCERHFNTYLSNKNYDIEKVYILTALIYLNIAALHHQPYAEMLFHLGKFMLATEIV